MMKRNVDNLGRKSLHIVSIGTLQTLLLTLLVSCCGCTSPQNRDFDTASNSSCRIPGGDPDVPSVPCLIAKIPLEDVSLFVDGNWSPDTDVRFSPDGGLLAIGSYLGRLRMWDVRSGRLLWEKRIAEGIVKRIDFSPDGKTVYFAEQSVDGYLLAADAYSGDIRWRFRTADDLESGKPSSKEDPFAIYQLPGGYVLKTLANGDILLLAIHSWGDDPLLWDVNRLSRIYRFAPDGALKWTYPKSAPLPMTIIHMDSDNEGNRIGFLVTKGAIRKTAPFPFEEGTAGFLNGLTGDLTWRYTFPPLRPYFDEVGLWESISVSEDGALASVGLFDGRSFLLDLEQRRIRKTFSFGAPLLISGVPVSASAAFTHIAPNHTIYFQTGSSSVPSASTMSHVVAPPGPHPEAQMLTAVDANGRIVWRYRSGRNFQNFWSDKRGFLVVTCVQKEDDRNGFESGAMLFDTRRKGGGTAKLVYYYQVRGKTLDHADMAEDGSAFALVEAPYRDPKTDKIIGEYAVHIVR